MNADGPAGTPTSSLGSGTVPNLRLTPNSPLALLIIDVQNAIDDPSWGQRNNLQAEHNIGQLLTAWRTNGLRSFTFVTTQPSLSRPTGSVSPATRSKLKLHHVPMKQSSPNQRTRRSTAPISRHS